MWRGCKRRHLGGDAFPSKTGRGERHDTTRHVKNWEEIRRGAEEMAKGQGVDGGVKVV